MAAPPLPPPGCTPDYVSPGLVSGTFGACLINVCRGELRAEDFRRAYGPHGPLQARYPRGTGVFVVVEPSIPLPPAEVREVALEAGKPYANGIAGTAIVLFGDGFWLSAARSALTALLVLTRQPYPTKFFGDLASAALWSGERLEGTGLDTAGLARAAEYLRQLPA